MKTMLRQVLFLVMVVALIGVVYQSKAVAQDDGATDPKTAPAAVPANWWSTKPFTEIMVCAGGRDTPAVDAVGKNWCEKDLTFTVTDKIAVSKIRNGVRFFLHQYDEETMNRRNKGT